MKNKLVISLLSLSMALALLAGCGSSSSDTGTVESDVEETQTVVETAIESTIETVIETTEASTIEEADIVDETIEESSVIESEESSVHEETSTIESSEPSKETTTNETPVVESQVESVVETAQETTTTTITSSSYSADEYISIVKSELIKNGIQWYPDSDEYKECRELFPDIYIGPDGGMGWAIIDVDMSNPYYVSEELLDGFKFDRLEYFYIEVLSSSNGNIQFKLYRG
jgi:hypothetical protein